MLPLPGLFLAVPQRHSLGPAGTGSSRQPSGSLTTPAASSAGVRCATAASSTRNSWNRLSATEPTPASPHASGAVTKTERPPPPEDPRNLPDYFGAVGLGGELPVLRPRLQAGGRCGGRRRFARARRPVPPRSSAAFACASGNGTAPSGWRPPGPPHGAAGVVAGVGQACGVQAMAGAGDGYVGEAGLGVVHGAR